ncbi:MAG: type II toxin-antitoxin system VapC family toxin [Candidatus Limnocylindrales bacterium]
MTALYLDSSAFVKLIVDEAEAAALRRHLAATRARRTSSALLRTEALRAVRHLGPEALALAREATHRVDLIAIDDRILDAAGLLEPGIVRTLDAIHLATALALGDDLEAIVTYDQRMVDGARLLGLPVVSVGARPTPG